MLASDADRDRVLAQLREAFAAGRITHDELAERVTRTLEARTLEDLHAVIADLVPPAPPAPYYRRHPGYRGYRPVPYRGYGLGRPRVFWLPFVVLAGFFWIPFWAGAHFFFFPLFFFGGFWLFALWRRSLRF
jgi:hypothetical protein